VLEPPLVRPRESRSMRTALADRFIGSLLSDAAVLEAPLFAGRERSNAADLLVRLAEIDVRQLYLAAGHPSLLAYCIEELRLSGDEAANRIYVARTARRFPILFAAIDEGGLDLTGVRLLASRLTEENAGELVTAASACRNKSDLQAFLQHRFAARDLLSVAPRVVNSHVPEHASGPATGVVQSHVPEHVAAPPAEQFASPPEHLPLPVAALEWVDVKVKARRAKWQYVRDLLSHSVPSGDASVIFDRALDALIEKAEKKKYAACTTPRAPRPRSARERLIPAHVRRAVWERDGGQCTFVSESGRRCKSRRRIEYDHVRPIARGGKASVEALRLLCRPHNQYEAEQALGAGFMKKKREEAGRQRTRTATPLPPGERFRDDVVAGLRTLGVNAAEARQIVARSGALREATLEASMRAAMRLLGPRRQRSA